MRVLNPTVTMMLIGLIGFLLAVGVGFVVFWLTRSDEPEVGMTAKATLLSSTGEAIGTVGFTQGESSVLVAAEAKGLEPGGHAFIVHSVGSCSPDFSAAGDHFDPDERSGGFVHPNWNRRDSSAPGHSGDLPNLYAGEDGVARADFFASGITLQSGQGHSLFDADGSSIIIHEKPSDYVDDTDTGQRIACGVIELD